MRNLQSPGRTGVSHRPEFLALRRHRHVLALGSGEGVNPLEREAGLTFLFYPWPHWFHNRGMVVDRVSGDPVDLCELPERGPGDVATPVHNSSTYGSST